MCKKKEREIRPESPAEIEFERLSATADLCSPISDMHLSGCLPPTSVLSLSRTEVLGSSLLAFFVSAGSTITTAQSVAAPHLRSDDIQDMISSRTKAYRSENHSP